MAAASPAHAARRRMLEIPLSRYEVRTKLSFPIKGPGIITQGPIQDLGHGGYAN